MADQAPRGRGLVDVVVPTYDAREVVLECLEHLDDPVIADRIVVDDVSSDGTIEAVRKRFPAAKVEALEEHRGLAHALNAGASRGSAPFILFINNDVFAEPGSVERLVRALEADPAGASAGGRLVDAATGATQDGYRPRDFPTVATFAARLFGVERLRPGNRWSGSHLRRRLGDDIVVRVDQQPAGACLLVRRSTFDAVAGWDEGYWFWYEDVDFSRRLAEMGPAIWVGPASFRHRGIHSTSHWSKHQQHQRLYHGTLRYARGHLPRAQATAVAAFVGLVCLPRFALAGLLGRPTAGIYRSLIAEAVAVGRGREATLTVPPAQRRRRESPGAVSG